MRPIQHRTFVTYGSRAWIRSEQIDDLLCSRQLFSAGRECFVDHIDLRRMNRQHAAPTRTPHQRGAFTKTRFILEVAVNGFDGGDASSTSPDQTKAARQLVREVITA